MEETISVLTSSYFNREMLIKNMSDLTANTQSGKTVDSLLVKDIATTVNSLESEISGVSASLTRIKTVLENI